MEWRDKGGKLLEATVVGWRQQLLVSVGGKEGEQGKTPSWRRGRQWETNDGDDDGDGGEERRETGEGEREERG